jgi:hypothetical protein
MANHVLSLEVPTVMNTCILKIFDASVYQTSNPNIPILCPTLTITVPGFAHSINISGTKADNFVAYGHTTITACDLGLQVTDCGSKFGDIPDGIYILKYSVSPNNQVYVEYNHMRITKALNKYEKVLCNVEVAACDPPYKIKEKLERLRLIKMYLEAAKAKVEFCHEPQKGMSLYNYAMKLLNKFECKNC